MKLVKMFLAILLIIIGITACKKTPTTPAYIVKTFTKDQTYCADPWGYSDSNHTATALVKTYFDAHHLAYENVWSHLDSSRIQVCTACTCKSGRLFYVSFADTGSLADAYFQLGFR